MRDWAAGQQPQAGPLPPAPPPREPLRPLQPSRPPGPTLGSESLPLQQLFHQPLDLSQLRVFPFHLQDGEIPIGASGTELGDPDPDSVLRILLLGGQHTQGDIKQSRA